MNAQQLRNSILQEAIEGRLVPQDPNDEPASVLLNRICEEKKRLVKEGKLKKKDLEETPISEDEKPFDIPDSWEWCRVSDLGEVITGGTPSKQNQEYYGDEYPFYKPGDLDKGVDICDSVDGLSQKGYDASRKLKAFSILVTCIGATIGKAGLIIKEGSCNQQINAIVPYNELCPQYIYYTICSPLLQSIIRKDAGQTTLPIMNKNNFSKLLFPLPPLAEQKRIVAKIEELLPKVEKYGKAQEALDKLNEELPERLKKSVLQEAISGKLVSQDPNDEPASVLLNRIREEKKRLVKEGKLKKKDLEETPISEDEIPFDIPDSWRLARLSLITSLIDGEKREGDYVCLDAKFLRGKSTGDMLSKGKYVKQGDNIILVDGENSGEVFTVPCEGYMGSTFKQLWVSESVYLPYVLSFIKYYKDILRNSKKGAAIPHLNKDIFYNLIIGIPTLAEQKRIVAKIEEAFKAIDALS